MSPGLLGSRGDKGHVVSAVGSPSSFSGRAVGVPSGPGSCGGNGQRLKVLCVGRRSVGE